MRTFAHPQVDRANDLYETPPSATRALLKAEPLLPLLGFEPTNAP